MLLAACGLIDGKEAVCPEVYIMEQAKKVTYFAPGSGRDLTDISYDVEIIDVTYKCSSDIDNDITIADLEIDILFEVKRGASFDGTKFSFHYFSVVTFANEKILAKETFVIDGEFLTNQRNVFVVEEISHKIPIRVNSTVVSYRSLVGLQFSKSQLKEKRNSHNR